MLTRIKVKNLKSFETFDLQTTSGLAIFCGPNGAGKTTLLLIPQLMHSLWSGQNTLLKQQGNTYTGCSKYLPYRDTSLHLDIELTFDFEQDFAQAFFRSLFSEGTTPENSQIQRGNFGNSIIYRLSLGNNWFGEELLTESPFSEKLVCLAKTETSAKSLIGKALHSADLKTISLQKLFEPNGLKEVGMANINFQHGICFRYLPPAKTGPWLPKIIEALSACKWTFETVFAERRIASDQNCQQREEKLNSDFGNLIGVHDSLMNHRDSVLEEIADIVKEAFPDLKRLRPRTIAANNSSHKTIGFIPSKKGIDPDFAFYLDDLSSGTKQFIGFVTKLLTSTAEWLLIEEPEVCLHPQAQSILLKHLTQHASKRYIWITSHSPVFLGEAPLNSIFLVSKNPETGFSTVEPAVDSKEFVERAGAQLGILPAHALLPNALILVEGVNDVPFYKRWLQNQGVERVEFLDTQGWTKTTAYAEARLAAEGIIRCPLFIILDGDTTEAEHTVPRERLEKLLREHGLEGNIFSLPVPSIEGLLLKKEIVQRAFPNLSEAEIIQRLAARPEEKPKKRLNYVVTGDWSKRLESTDYAKLADACADVPCEIQEMIGKVVNAIRTNAK